MVTVAVVIAASFRDQKRRGFVPDLAVVVRVLLFPSVMMMMIFIVRMVVVGMIVVGVVVVVVVIIVGVTTARMTVVRMIPVSVVIAFLAMSFRFVSFVVVVTVTTTFPVIVLSMVVLSMMIVSVVATAASGQVDVVLSQNEGHRDVHDQTDPRDRRHQRSVDRLVRRVREADDGTVGQPEADEREARDAEERGERFAPLETVRVLPRRREAREVARGDRHGEGRQVREEVRRVAQDRERSRQDPPRHLHDEEDRAQVGGGLELPDDHVVPLVDLGGGVRRRRCIVFSHDRVVAGVELFEKKKTVSLSVSSDSTFYECYRTQILFDPLSL